MSRRFLRILRCRRQSAVVAMATGINCGDGGTKNPSLKGGHASSGGSEGGRKGEEEFFNEVAGSPRRTYGALLREACGCSRMGRLSSPCWTRAPPEGGQLVRWNFVSQLRAFLLGLQRCTLSGKVRCC